MDEVAQLVEHDVVDDFRRHDGQVGVHGNDGLGGHARAPAGAHDALAELGHGDAVGRKPGEDAGQAFGEQLLPFPAQQLVVQMASLLDGVVGQLHEYGPAAAAHRIAQAQAHVEGTGRPRHVQAVAVPQGQHRQGFPAGVLVQGFHDEGALLLQKGLDVLYGNAGPCRYVNG